MPRGESSEDEGGAEVGADLTRSITAPSFITRDLRSRDPSHDDLIGSATSLQQGHQAAETKDGRSVINIKHALSETYVESLTEESNISSVHIGGEDDKALEDGDEGPFTITFKNVSAAPPEFTARVGQDPAEAEDHEVVGVLQDDGVSSGRPPGGDLYTYTNQESFTNIHLLTGTTDSCISGEDVVSGRRESGGERGLDRRELPGGSLQQSSSLRLVRFAESKGRSEYSESSDSSAERSSSLFVECDSDRHSVSDVLSDDLNPPSAKLVVAHLTDVEHIVQRRSLATSRSFEESPHSTAPCIERQYSEVIPDAVYLTREHLYPNKIRERNQIRASRSEPSRIVESELYDSVAVNTTRPVSPGKEHPTLRRAARRDEAPDRREARSPTTPRSPHTATATQPPESNHPTAITTTTTTTKAASSVASTATTTTTTTTTTVTALSPPVKASMTITQVEEGCF